MKKNEKIYRFHWLSGKIEEINGKNAVEAFQRLGHTNGEIKTLNYCEEVKV
jgi:hypothetical protein